MTSILLLLSLFADLPREAVDAEIAITAQVVRIESVIPLPDDFERRKPIPEPKPSTPQPSVKCDCGGSGFVTDATNWRRVRCPCGKNCGCGSRGLAPPATEAVSAEPKHFQRSASALAIADKERANRGVMISAAWCGPCQTVKTNEIPKLVAATWLVNKGPESHLLILDNDTEVKAVEAILALPGAPERVAVLPTFVRIQNNVVTATHEGALDAGQIARFVYPSLAPAAAAENSAQAAPGGNSGPVCPRCGKIHAPQTYSFETRRKQFLWWELE